ncbi:MAG TPA: 50S ribosomal protein L24 [Nitrososphaeraceae archaeon]
MKFVKQAANAFVSSNVTSGLREQYGKRSLRPIKGDTIKVLRGEYSGIEGKIEKVNTKTGALSIEGVQREKIRGGNVKVPIHASNVQIVSLKLDDKFRLKVAERKVKEEDSQTLNKEIPKKTDKVEVDQTITLEEGSKMNSNKKIKKRNLDKRRKA